MRRFSLVLPLLLLLGSAGAQAWSNHALASGVVFQPLLAGAPPVAVESLEQFVVAEAEGLAQRLAQQDAFAQASFAHYPALDARLRFTGERADVPALLRALRLNPATRLGYFVQAVPGTEDWQQLPVLAQSAVLIYRDLDSWRPWRFYGLTPGQRVSPLAVLASASDEPDYGMDINLFVDGGSEQGALYGFGRQPFGADGYEHSSQAPFHMTFYDLPWIVRTLAPELSRTYPSLRAYQFFDLARFAFDTGHPYWGYRFAGWGLHYVQDLTQPYHSALMPGFNTAALLWLYTQSALGQPAALNDAIGRVAHRHTLLEDRQMASLAQQLAEPGLQSLELALTDDRQDADYPAFDAGYLYRVIAAQSHASAGPVDAQTGQAAQDNPVSPLLVELSRHFGQHSRQALAPLLAR